MAGVLVFNRVRKGESTMRTVRIIPRDLRGGGVLGFAVALFVLVGVAPPVQAQVCASCLSGYRYNYYEEDGSPDIGHAFPYGEDGCAGGVLLPTSCVLCGGSSRCHEEIETGPCHISCGPATDALAAVIEIQDALDRDDVTLLAAAVSRERVGVSAEFIREGGRIDLILPCDPNVAFRTIPVLPRTNAELAWALRSTSTVVTTPSAAAM